MPFTEVMVNGPDDVYVERKGRIEMVLDLADERADVDDGVVAVVGLGAWCDFVTPAEYRQRLVRGGWRATVERQSGADQIS